MSTYSQTLYHEKTNKQVAENDVMVNDYEMK